MKTYKIFNKEIILRDKSCCNEKNINENKINLFIKITNLCNCSCSFCSEGCYKKDIISEDFNLYKLFFVISEIFSLPDLKINKITFTGGEPTLDIPLIEKIINYIRFKDRSIFIGMNTNGLFLKNSNSSESENFINLFDGISISRNGIDDKTNMQIFNSNNVPELSTIKNLSKEIKNKIHFSAILQKGIIDSKEKIKEYLEMAANTGIPTVGFVSLMSSNNFCKNQFIDFRHIDLKGDDNIFLTKEREYEDICCCNEYIYISDTLENKQPKIVNFYNRYYYNPERTDGTLVFDGKNLKTGFKGEIIL